ncbi:MAG: YfhO family protein, partial [Acidobacteria bacterium]|nr:YfhO family protein [Acidobacteriota bacterium]
HGPTDFRLRVATPRPTLVASSQPAMPWWRVRVNGETVQPVRINGAFLGFWVPGGVADVSVRYRSVPFRGSVAVCLGALVALVLGSRMRGRNAL